MNSRREFLETAGLGGLSSLILGANVLDGGRDEIGAEEIAAAERLFGIDFTAAERDALVGDLRRAADGWRAAPFIANDVPPTFGPLTTAAPRRAARPIRIDGPDAAAVNGTRDLAFAPAWRLGEMVRKGEVTSVALTQVYLDRLKRLDEKLHMVVTPCRDAALELAVQLDAETAKGTSRGPLHGVPYGLKDIIAVPGFPTTWGARPFADRVLDVEATVAARLRDAGCPLVAKLSVGALAMGDVWFGGRTRNPWNPEQGSSGSSAGPAAAVAAGCVGFAIGTETLGSIVSPSTRCGATGLRPSFGRVSRHGVMALTWSMDKVGPLARSVRDCALVYSVIAGPDGIDPHLVDRDPVEGDVAPPKAMRVGFLDGGFGAAHRRDREVLEELEELGFELESVAIPAADPSFRQILEAEASCAFDEILRDGRVRDLVSQDARSWPQIFRRARFTPAVEYLRASRLRTELSRAMNEAMADIDVLVAPTFRGGALVTTNLSGHPCVCLPNGFGGDGTPRSITFIGKLHGENALLRVAAAYQDATGFHLERPGIG